MKDSNGAEMVNKKPYFIIILGPPATGKMTIGQEVVKRTNDFKLFHNHLIIESLLPVFEFESQSFKKLSRAFRTQIFEELILLKPNGVVFTFVVNYKNKSALDLLIQWIDLFKQNDFEVCIVELTASLDTRLLRNETANRLEHKYSKRDISFSRKILLKNEEEWDMISPEGFYQELPFLKIDTEHTTANEVAEKIISHFGLLKQHL